MSEDAAVGGVGRILGKVVVPLEGGSRVVGTMSVVVVKAGALVVGKRDIGIDSGSGRLGLGLGDGLGLLLLNRLLGRLNLLNGGSDDNGRRLRSASALLSLGGSRLRLLEEDNAGGLLASRDGDGNNLHDPVGHDIALLGGDRAGRGQQGAGANEEE